MCGNAAVGGDAAFVVAICQYCPLFVVFFCCYLPLAVVVAFSVYAVLMMLLLSLLPLPFVIAGFGYYVQLAHISFSVISTNLLCHLSSWYYFVYLVGATLLLSSLQTHVIVSVVATGSSQPLNASLLLLVPDQTHICLC